MAEIGWEGIVTIISIVISLVIMAGDWVGPDLVFLTLLGFLTACRVITPAQAAAGFSNNGLLTVMALYVVAEGINQTGGLERVMNRVLGRSDGVFWALVRMQLPVMFTSAFLNNTPIVALMIPILLSWSRRCSVSPKKLLIPLSYAATFGGTATLIGTSTNLVVSGYQEKRYAKQPPYNQMGIFDMSPYGVPYAIWGALYIVWFARWLLPNDGGSTDTQGALVGLRVPKGSRVAGNTVAEAGLRGLDGLFLVCVRRKGRTQHAVGPEFIVLEDDILYFAGDLSKVDAAAAQFRLVLVTHETEETESEMAPLEGTGYKADSAVVTYGATEILVDAEAGSQVASTGSSQRLLKCMVRPGCPLVGKSVREVGFRAAFQAAVVAVKRRNVKLGGRIGDIVLQGGDSLVLDVGPGFNPNTTEATANFDELDYVSSYGDKEYMTAFRVEAGSTLVGKTIQHAGLRGVPGLFLVRVDRADGTQLHAVAPDTTLQAEDTVWFAGNLDSVTFLLKMPGLTHTDADHQAKMKINILERRLVQVVVAPHSHLIGKTVRESQFRTKYDAAIVAVHRKGQRLCQKIGDILLELGDVLLLDTGSHFLTHHAESKAFALVSEVANSSPLKTSKMWLALLLGTAMVSTQIIESFTKTPLINLWIAAILTSALMMLTGCMSGKQARDAMDWTVFICIGAAFGVGNAMEVSGVSDKLGNLFVNIVKGVGGRTAICSALYIATALLTEILSNNAAAALMYPVGAAAGDALGIPPTWISYTIMFGASAGFMSPFGYQCNLMVYAAGNYKTMEFVKFGAPLLLWMWIGTTLIFYFADTWYIMWIICGVLTALTLGGAWVWAQVPTQIRVSVEASLARLACCFRR